MSRAIPPDTVAAQALASNPGNSAWVSANAGSGKTFVLTQRVLRLLLNGVKPSQILCLTFTKAAAANMSTRVFDRLRSWTQMDDARLRRELDGLDADAKVSLAEARRLFARTIETPGGLKIQTIHAFCESVLHRFPFEAGVPSQFRLVVDLEQQELLDEALAETIARADRDGGALADALAFLASECDPDRLGKLLKEIAGKKRAVQACLAQCGGPAGLGKALASLFGLSAAETIADIQRRMTDDGVPPSEWETLAKEFERGKDTDRNQASALRTAFAAQGQARLDAYLSLFLTGSGTARARVATASVDKTVAALMQTEQERILGLLDKLRAARHVERSVALFTAAEAYLTAYERRKARRDLLDFDDLIARTTALLAQPRSAWVLFKLDNGIDHILIDEAQDTSPEQWAILTSLAEEFFSGMGRSTAERTLFAVGDDKQSIYSFQGAAPHMFDEMRRKLGRKIEESHKAFKPVELKLSFRSASGLLGAVDGVMRALPPGFSSDPAPPQHEAFKTALPSRVEIWPVIAADKTAAAPDWIPAPESDPQASDTVVRLAERVAGEIARLTAPGSDARVHDVTDHGLVARPIRPGDVMILVRSRGPLFEAIIRALKDAQVPVAGADRLKLAEHIAVMDLIAAGRAALLPEDDLTLACVLKSPLIGFDEDDLFALATGRGKASLHQALLASPREKDRAAAARLADWRRRALAETPFRFYADLLGRQRGRSALFARLGAEAGDAVNEFLRLALEHEATSIPSLQLFLDAIVSGDIEVKRDMEAEQDSVRVMTVHGAKGLEAKVVFLPDTCGKAVNATKLSSLFALRDPAAPDGAAPLFVWAAPKADQPERVAQEREARLRAETQENHRLLYVAMTRAEERLYLCGHKKAEEGCWLTLALDALKGQMKQVDAPWDPADRVWRMDHGTFGAGGAAPESPVPEAPLPDWLTRDAPEERQSARISPSGAGGGSSARRAAGDDAAAYGSLVHELLEGLPGISPERRPDAGANYAALRGGALSEARRAAAVQEALQVLALPELAELFGPDSRAEVAIESREGGVLVSGRMDRMAVTPSRVIVADFKTGGGRDASIYAGQIGHYRRMLAELYPEREILCLIVFTQAPLVVQIEGR